MVNWEGVFPAVTTQFHEDLSLDLSALALHLEKLLDSGISGVVMLGSLGENNTLHADEKLAVLKTAREVCGGKVPVVTGVSELSTDAAIQFAQKAEYLGIDGLMVLPAMAYPADDREAIAHYRAVVGSVDLPVIIYNNPIAYPVDLTPKLLGELADLDQCFGVKESSGDTRRVTDIFNELGDRYTIFAGVDDLALECAVLGAKGWIAGIGLAFPEENQHLWNLMMAGRWDEAREIYRWYSPLLHLDVGPKFVHNIKLAIQEAGLGSEWMRAPRLPLEGEERERVLGIIRHGIKHRPTVSA